MDGIKLIYRNDSGVVIVRLPNGKYYYGNGKTFGGIGVEPNQFLRFNPYLRYVEDEETEIPEDVIKWIRKHIKMILR